MFIDTISLSLGGGAARGVFHLGVLQKLDELDIKIKAISGSSIGAFVGVCYGGGMKPKEILKIIQTKEFKKAFKPNLSLKSLIKIDETSDIVQQLLPCEKLEDLNIPTYVTCVDLLEGKVVYFDSGDTLKTVLGSCALVPFFQAVEYGKYVLVDGGFVDNLPIIPLKKYKLPICGVDLHPSYKITKTGVSRNLSRALSLCLAQNTILTKKECNIFITNNKLSDYSLFTFRNYDEMFDLGYKSVDIKMFQN
ncbi:Patatin-like phospholipase [Campylobacter blaseri]|uniref:PNPLA domain-containing protein n=1 Tax=Campylobacter blaseri TaxID=2042961 RepID=A0A2P8QZ68_9BACT|nr:patatin-like phospholipase family protein [Campylobacter blaseri]PSM51543.1 hypothetical protein CQ405_07035 [Campylobacter blaseri]PSM53336.1 hypothetical protein CRN67_07040 [Campylobacter blaseri]QKF86629.1 Patatin-like phospholipase [Campylobacter blaseri]